MNAMDPASVKAQATGGGEMAESWLDLSNRLACVIREKRKAAELTQAQLAQMTDTKQSAIARLESENSDSLPSVQMLKRIADALGADLKIDIQ